LKIEERGLKGRLDSIGMLPFFKEYTLILLIYFTYFGTGGWGSREDGRMRLA
jgi:hypothetical protein